MSDLRWHPLLREWVTVAPWRQDRTYHPSAEFCPLCPTRPGGPETEIPEPDYHIAVFENRFPSYSGDQGGGAGEGLRPAAPGGSPPYPQGGGAGEGLRPAAPGGSPPYPRGGRCEVVCYTPVHESSLGEQSVAHIRDLIEVWSDRTEELSRLDGVRYVYVFENRGEEMGVTLHHPHGQIYAYPFVPPVLERELAASRDHLDRTGRCLYCDVLEAEVDGERVVARDQGWLAFVPPFNRWPYEVHLAPSAHLGLLPELTDSQAWSFAGILKDVLQRYDRLFGRPLPYVMAMHQGPPGGGDHHHLHVEFYPPNRTADRLKYLAGSELGAGAFIVDARAEDGARELREA